MKKTNYAIPIITLLLLIAMSQSALAASKRWYGTVGGVDVRAEKTLTLGGSGWSTYLYSTADFPINIIGMTYWTLEEYCPATNTYAYYNRYSGAYDTYDTYFSRSAYVQYRGCSGISRHKSHGNHDFAHGSDHVYPYVAVTVDR